MFAVDLHDLGPGLIKEASISLPHKVATAAMPERGELSRYPDSDFGVVMFGREGKLRKFACTSPEVAWLNGQYLAESWDGMPKTAAVVAGVRLLEKMEEGGYSSPGLVAKVAVAIPTVTARDGEVREIEGLGSIVDIRDWEKLAGLGRAAARAGGAGLGFLAGGAAGLRTVPLDDTEISPAHALGVLATPIVGAGLGSAAGAKLYDAVKTRREKPAEFSNVPRDNLGGPPGAVIDGHPEAVKQWKSALQKSRQEGGAPLWHYGNAARASRQARQKTAFTLLDLGAVGALGGGTVGAGTGFIKARKAGATKTETLKRTAGGALKGGVAGLAPAVAVGGTALALDLHRRHLRHKAAALNGKYPIETEEQVKQAMVYFDRFWKSFHPADRREYCRNVKLAAAAHEVEVTEKVAAYGGDQLNEAFVLHLNARASRVDERGGAILMKLASVATHKGPDEFGKALTQFDEHYGLSQQWDGALPDPYRAAFSEKTASEDANYHWVKGIDRVTGADLLRIAREDIRLVHNALGDEISEEFVKKPVTIFKSLPYPQQVILARLADSRSHVRGSS